ncbi:unnamed protein product [Calypogeia fissa]
MDLEVLLPRAIKADTDHVGKLILINLQTNQHSGVAMVDTAKQWWKDFKDGHECLFFHLHPKTKTKEVKVGPDCG